MIILIFVFTCSVIISGNEVPFFMQPKIDDNEFGSNLGISASLNKSTKPCDNFYEYACGGWIKKTVQPDFQPLWNQWQSVTQKISKRMENILKIKKSAPKYLLKAQTVYKVCLQKNSSKKYLQNLKGAINNLGGWPLAMQSWNESGYDWANSVAKVTRTLGIYPLLKMHVFVDLQNTSQHSLYIEHGELNLPETILAYPQRHKDYIKAYLVWIFETIQQLYPGKKHSDLKTEIAELIRFEIEVAKLIHYKEKSEKISVNTLEEELPLKWMDIFDKLFYTTSVNINPNDKVILRCRKYLSKLLMLILNTKTRTVKNHIIWSAVKNLSSDTTNQLRRLSFMMDTIIFGIKKDLPWTQECINRITTYMDTALMPAYSKLYLQRQSVNDVSIMTKSIQAELMETLRNNIWLQNKTRNTAIEKIASLKYIIAYPKWLNNDTFLERRFDEVVISNNHFANMIRLKSFKMKNYLQKLKQSGSIEWPGSLFEVNAYYSILQNSIFIPVGMLEPPFYDIHGPRVRNYGALGSLIGHEISHALDVLGRHADKNGNIHNWWPETDALKYETTISCFKKQYDNYNVNGIDTLGENIADNVGLQISYNAFKNLRNESSSRSLTEFSEEQLFFISFSQAWCEIPSENKLANEDEYAPVRTRVMGTLQNNKEFYRAFGCKNNNKKCSLW